jgi:transaldolase
MSERTSGTSPDRTIGALRVKLFADGADLTDMAELARRPYILGFTTNPTLMRKAGIGDYRQFAQAVMEVVQDRPVSFEVCSDEFAEMEAEAREIATWGASVVVKIPVTNTRAAPSYDLIHRLSHSGVKVNVTAVMTLDQVTATSGALAGGAPSMVSVFAGRIADTGRDPMPIVAHSVRILAAEPQIQLVWASPRELLNVFQADESGCHVITLTTDILSKFDLIGKDLADFSLDTVKMFHRDAVKAGLTLGTSIA